MKIWFPKRLDKNDDLSVYKTSCNLAISTFRMCLNYYLNVPSLTRIERILKENNMLEFTNKDRFSIMGVIQQYESSLQCYYDAGEQRCYFEISHIAVCQNTKNKLDYVIRLIEFGNDKIPPTNWVRHSYTRFCKIYGGYRK